MRYCKNCGAELDETDTFCAKCGAHAATGAPTTRRVMPSVGTGNATYTYEPAEKEPTEKLFCELAFSGVLFWLPLVTGSRHPYAKLCVSQGRLALNLGAVASTGISGIRWLLGLVSVGPLAGITHIIYSLLFMAFLFFMFYLLYRYYCGAMAIHRDEQPENLLFPGRKGENSGFRCLRIITVIPTGNVQTKV